ncbi:hypothetical protein HHI36_018961 [Cryptolaemus montrouzieri]|uniref:Breast cancer anti-estrogen resistance protein 1 n=1 Tax=Cryptolaemus montrouzieri TaxID=559131 RepID=A0ABD2P1N0_9CUCU
MPNRCSPLHHQPPGSLQHSGSADYDVPPSRHTSLNTSQGYPRCTSASPSCASPVSRDGEAYDVPRPHINHSHHLNHLTPSSSASSLTADSISSSNRSSMVNMPDYDVPKPHSKGLQLVLHPSQLYDVPPSHNPKELPLELNSALENLERLENDTTSSIKKLLGFVGPGWRRKDRLAETILDIKLAVTRLQTSLNDLAEFGEGTLGNATKASDKNLAIKLAPLVSSLRKSYHTVNNAAEKMSESNWNIELLAISEDLEDRYVPDALDTLISCSKALTEDIRQITSFIQGNGLLLFKKESGPSWTNEYDYVQLNSREKHHKNPSDSKHLQKNYDLIENQEEISSDSELNLDSNDRHLLTFFGAQFITHHKNLMLAIEAFLNTVERNQPPKIFLAHGKFVVLSAHKLVHIGDTVYRNITCKKIKERALNCANALSDVLAQSVVKTKQAALQFPTVTAVQEMVDSVLDTSHAANNLKLCLLQAMANFL